jgi:hypothetical protein
MGKIVLVESNAPTFEKCELRKPCIGDLKHATRLAGGGFDGEATADQQIQVSLILIHLCAKFDGQKWPVEEIEKLGVDFFTEASSVWGISVNAVPTATAAESLV